MFRNAYRLPFKLLGIPIQLDLTFLIILPLLAWLIGSNIESFIKSFGLGIDPVHLKEGLLPLSLGLAAALGLFVSILLHELGHSVVGQYFGFRVKVITLWLLGGMAQFENIPRRRGAEAIMAAAGPITSYVLAGVCWVALSATPRDLPALKFVLAYLMWMNTILATFNLLPALPLDGGRIFRSFLALRMNYLKATMVATGVSKVLAIALGLLGFAFGHIFLMLIALFIYIAVTGESQMTTAAEVLHGIEVRHIMTREVKTVSPEMTVADLLQKMLKEKHLTYPVVDDAGIMVGMVSLTSIQSKASLDHDQPSVIVEEIMSSDFSEIGANESALDAFKVIGQNVSGRLVVLDAQRRLRGIISKTDLVRAVQVRMVGYVLERLPEQAAVAGTS